MKGFNTIYHSCVGDSHEATGKPCQDASFAENTDLYSMAIVSDGHGGERYFRSHIGSQKAVEITANAIRMYVNNALESDDNFPFEDNKLMAYSQEMSEQMQEIPKAHNSLRWLFSSIISQWNSEITVDAFNRDLDDWEQEHVDSKYLEEFKHQRKLENPSFEKTYGCTLMAYVQTKKFWLAFHIGDGKFVMLNRNKNGSLEFSQPLPWDSRCFLNKTTSLCDNNALDEFRYCYGGDGMRPIAAFLGSDGIDDSFGSGDYLYNFYINLYKELVSSRGNVKQLLEKDLPTISARGSKDDMSVACVYQSAHQQKLLVSLLSYQIDIAVTQRDNAGKKVNILKDKVYLLSDKETRTPQEDINLQYASKDLDKAEDEEKRLYKKIQKLSTEKGVIKRKRN